MSSSSLLDLRQPQHLPRHPLDAEQADHDQEHVAELLRATGEPRRPRLRDLEALVPQVLGLAAVIVSLQFDLQAWGSGLVVCSVGFVLLALVPQLIGHSAFNWALRYLPASYVSLMSLGEPVATIAMVAVLFGEVPSAVKLSGCALILVGLAVASRRATTGATAAA